MSRCDPGVGQRRYIFARIGNKQLWPPDVEGQRARRRCVLRITIQTHVGLVEADTEQKGTI